QRAQTQLSNQHRTGTVKALDNGRVLRGYAISKRLGAIGCRNARRVEKIFGSPRDAMQRTAILAGCDFPVSVLGLCKRVLAGGRDDATQLGIELLQTREVELGKLL